MKTEPRRTDPVYQITGVARGLDEDLAARSRRYAYSMGLRSLCFVLAVVTEGWLRWTFVGGAIILPYIAVVMANAGREPNRPLPRIVLPTAQQAIEARVRETKTGFVQGETVPTHLARD